MLNDKTQIRLSKFMTRMLRHSPDAYGLLLDPEDGSCALEDLLSAIRSERRWSAITQADVEQVVRSSDKQRFELQEGRIRARYGHSFQKISYTPGTPPAVLYHGTNTGAAPVILKEGISSMGRQYVHLSEGLDFATLSGQRRGELVILSVDTGQAMEFGVDFYYAGNEVWLAEWVPAEYCSVYSGKTEKK